MSVCVVFTCVCVCWSELVSGGGATSSVKDHSQKEARPPMAGWLAACMAMYVAGWLRGGVVEVERERGGF